MTNRNTNFEYKVSGSVVITSRVTLGPQKQTSRGAAGGIDARAESGRGASRLGTAGIEDIAEKSGLNAREAVLGEIEDLSLRLGTPPTAGQK